MPSTRDNGLSSLTPPVTAADAAFDVVQEHKQLGDGNADTDPEPSEDAGGDPGSRQRQNDGCDDDCGAGDHVVAHFEHRRRQLGRARMSPFFFAHDDAHVAFSGPGKRS